MTTCSKTNSRRLAKSLSRVLLRKTVRLVVPALFGVALAACGSGNAPPHTGTNAASPATPVSSSALKCRTQIVRSLTNPADIARALDRIDAILKAAKCLSSHGDNVTLKYDRYTNDSERLKMALSFVVRQHVPVQREVIYRDVGPDAKPDIVREEWSVFHCPEAYELEGDLELLRVATDLRPLAKLGLTNLREVRHTLAGGEVIEGIEFSWPIDATREVDFALSERVAGMGLLARYVNGKLAQELVEWSNGVEVLNPLFSTTGLQEFCKTLRKTIASAPGAGAWALYLPNSEKPGDGQRAMWLTDAKSAEYVTASRIFPGGNREHWTFDPARLRMKKNGGDWAWMVKLTRIVPTSQGQFFGDDPWSRSGNVGILLPVVSHELVRNEDGTGLQEIEHPPQEYSLLTSGSETKAAPCPWFAQWPFGRLDGSGNSLDSMPANLRKEFGIGG